MSCAWCGVADPLLDRLVFDIAAFRNSPDQYSHTLVPWGTFGRTDAPMPLCVVDREFRYDSEFAEGSAWDGPEGAGVGCVGRHDVAHRCACGHTSSYHQVQVNVDHGLAAAAFGVDLCRSCARFVVVATRRRLGRPEKAGQRPEPVDVDDIDALFDDPLRGLSEREVATAARKFFRKFEGAST